MFLNAIVNEVFAILNGRMSVFWSESVHVNASGSVKMVILKTGFVVGSLTDLVFSIVNYHDQNDL